jgi:P-type conjugative transfer protein TrbG
MNRWHFTLSVVLFLLPPAAGSAQEIPAIQPAAALPPEIPMLGPDKPLTARQRAAVTAASTWRKRAAPPAVGEDGWVRFPFGQGEPSIVCAPLHVCDLALEPGEIVNPPIFLADKRWTAEPGVSGEGDRRTTHVILKPADVGLTSNMVIHTNRRSYSIQLVSRAKDYMPLVAFDYPADTTASWRDYAARMEERTSSGAPATPCDQMPTIPPDAFTTTGDAVPWKPVQVYAVATPTGQKTCVQLPADIGSRDLPALLALGDDGGWFSDPSLRMVSARFMNDRFVVDGLLDRFVLVDGVGSAQRRVMVERKR